MFEVHCQPARCPARIHVRSQISGVALFLTFVISMSAFQSPARSQTTMADNWVAGITVTGTAAKPTVASINSIASCSELNAVPAHRLNLQGKSRFAFDLSGTGFLQVVVPDVGASERILIHPASPSLSGACAVVSEPMLDEAVRRLVNLDSVPQTCAVRGQAGVLTLIACQVIRK